MQVTSIWKGGWPRVGDEQLTLTEIPRGKMILGDRMGNKTFFTKQFTDQQTEVETSFLIRTIKFRQIEALHFKYIIE